MALSRDAGAEPSNETARLGTDVSRTLGAMAKENPPLPSSATGHAPPVPVSYSSAPDPSPPSTMSSTQSLIERHPVRINIPPSLHSMVAGAGAGLVSSIATCPLDVVKTTLQAQVTKRGSQNYEGVAKTCLRIYKQSGLRGFYRGLGPTIGGYLPTWGIYFTVYDYIKEYLSHVPKAKAHPDASHVVAAMVAGGTGTILTNPLWVVKTRFMAQAILPPSAPRYKNTFQAFYSIYKNEGFLAFYKGLTPSLFGVSHVAVQFGLYEKAKSWAARENGGQPLSPTTILVCSAASKMCASLATYPHEVLRTRIQIQRHQSPQQVMAPQPSVPPPAHGSVPGTAHLYSPLVTGSNPPYPEGQEPQEKNGGKKRTRWTPKRGGIIDVFRKIYRQDGWRGFYRGLSINLIRTVPSSAVTMLSYELIMRHLSQPKPPQELPPPS